MLASCEAFSLDEEKKYIKIEEKRRKKGKKKVKKNVYVFQYRLKDPSLDEYTRKEGRREGTRGRGKEGRKIEESGREGGRRGKGGAKFKTQQ